MTPTTPSADEAFFPLGTVTLYFTDIEGSTRLLHAWGDEFGEALERHRAIIRENSRRNGGKEVDNQGDAMFMVFEDAREALSAAIAINLALATETWPGGQKLRVRAALHTGSPSFSRGHYFGMDLHRSARICAVAHGGQLLLSQSTAALVRTALPAEWSLRSLGEVALKDFPIAEPLFQVEAPGLESDFPRLRTTKRIVAPLPQPATAMFGREGELLEIQGLLNQSPVRLVTLTGPGGMGKTRLALEVAHALAGIDPSGGELLRGGQLGESGSQLVDPTTKPLAYDEVVFVDLQNVLSASEVPTEIGRALGVTARDDLPLVGALAEVLQNQATLLVLDNFEQVIEAAVLVAQLLGTCPRLKVLVTSRGPLRIRGEQEFPLVALGLATAGEARLNSAVALFEARSRNLNPAFALDGAGRAAAAEICELLDGLPLAIELAAARTRLFPPVTLLAMLRAAADSPVSMLVAGPRDLPRRQQTLRSTIAWSYDLLTPMQQIFFRSLSPVLSPANWVLLGSLRNSAVGNCPEFKDQDSDVETTVQALLDGGLVTQVQLSDGQPAVTLLNTIRAFGREELNKSEEGVRVRALLAEYFARKVFEEAGIDGEGLERLDVYYPDIRVAMEWLVASGRPDALKVAWSLWTYWQVRGLPREADDILGRALATVQPDWSPELVANAWNQRGAMAYGRGQFAQAMDCFERALEMRRVSNLRQDIAASLNNTGLAARKVGDYALAEKRLQESLDLLRGEFPQGIPLKQAQTLNNLGNLAREQDQLEKARTFFEESLEIIRHAHDRQALAAVTNNLGLLALDEGDLSAAQKGFEESLAIERQFRNRLGAASSLCELAKVFALQGNFVSARSAIQESLATGVELEDAATQIGALEALAVLRIECGEYPEASALWSLIRRRREDLKLWVTPLEERQWAERMRRCAAGAGREEGAPCTGEPPSALEKVIRATLTG